MEDAEAEPAARLLDLSSLSFGPTLLCDTGGFALSERREVLGDYLLGSFDFPQFDDVAPEALHRLRASGRSLNAGYLISTSHGAGMSLRVGRGADKGRGLLVLRRFVAGGSILEIGDRMHAVGVDALYLSEEQNVAVTPRWAAFESFVVPRESLPTNLPWPCMLSLPRASPMGRLVDAALDAAFETPVDAPPDQARAVESALCALIGAAFAPKPERTPRRHTSDRRMRMRAYIDENLERHDLDAALLQSVFGMSRAALYASFKPLGGVNSFIDGARLRRARDEILAAPRRRGEIARIAAHWGWHDLGRFNRGFRRAFGVAPRRTLGALASGRGRA